MQRRSNPIAHRLLALLCFCLALLTAIPCTAATLPLPASEHAMVDHCAPCCKSSPVAATTLCCQGHPQPAQAVTATYSSQAALTTRPTTAPGTTAVIALTGIPTPHQPPSHPLLHPILRI